jgi:hypothetical protein
MSVNVMYIGRFHDPQGHRYEWAGSGVILRCWRSDIDQLWECVLAPEKSNHRERALEETGWREEPVSGWFRDGTMWRRRLSNETYKQVTEEK